MRIPRIYTHQPLSNGASLELESGASQHLARALRMTCLLYTSDAADDSVLV